MAAEADFQRRFGGAERLYGVDGARAIHHAHVAVVGIGGVGSWAAEALARSGVGQITLVDLDHVSESNINRQVHALAGTVGQAKVVAMAERIAQINPDCSVHRIEEFVEPGNWPQLLPPGVTAVIDACDQMKAKVAMAAWARRTALLFISVGAAGGKRLAHKVDVDDLADTTHDPLLAQLRYQLRKHHDAPRQGRKIGIACVFSREAVAAPDLSPAVTGDGSGGDSESGGGSGSGSTAEGDGTLNCHGYGSAASVTATFGLCAAGWLMDRIASQKPLSTTL